MMFIHRQLDKVLARARKIRVIPFDAEKKFILFSDCHRGDNSWRDDFAHNRNIFYHALSYYYDAGFHYIELGDGDELWENYFFRDILKANNDIFRLLARFYAQGRLDLLFGNHDHIRQDPAEVIYTLSRYYDEVQCRELDLFPGITVYEAIILQYRKPENEIFLVHGHQGQLLNDYFWRVGRTFVRHIWSVLQFIGWHDPTRPAENFLLQNRIGNNYKCWAGKRRKLMIAGHTHKPMFPPPGEPPYFNTGSCVHPHCITGIEIERGAISLIKWHLVIKKTSAGRVSEVGELEIRRSLLEGPVELAAYNEKKAYFCDE